MQNAIRSGRLWPFYLIICSLIVLLSAANLTVNAQTIVGRISGTVKDETGALIPLTVRTSEP